MTRGVMNNGCLLSTDHSAPMQLEVPDTVTVAREGLDTAPVTLPPHLSSNGMSDLLPTMT